MSESRDGQIHSAGSGHIPHGVHSVVVASLLGLLGRLDGGSLLFALCRLHHRHHLGHLCHVRLPPGDWRGLCWRLRGRLRRLLCQGRLLLHEHLLHSCHLCHHCTHVRLPGRWGRRHCGRRGARSGRGQTCLACGPRGARDVGCLGVVPELPSHLGFLNALSPRARCHLSDRALLARLPRELLGHLLMVLILHLPRHFAVPGVGTRRGLNRLQQIRKVLLNDLTHRGVVPLLFRFLKAGQVEEVILLEERVVFFGTRHITHSDKFEFQQHLLVGLLDLFDRLRLRLLLAEVFRHTLFEHSTDKGVHKNLLSPPKHGSYPLVQGLQRYHLRDVVEKVALFLGE
eukprot:Hpha_TRINITY_DN16130_c0_g2::TRINITY_DN16130_c0_g2_i8::g.5778::m.5778